MRKKLVFFLQRKILTTPTQPLHLNRQPEYQGVKFLLDAVTDTAFKPAAVDVLRFSPLHVT
ncbi:hypothetical protein DPMN_005805 [Dreissena polymorpha]|uniref:Uncharacterized protein n=1 Tax=Dreissena polymorpha TaxID=45954 RepID=A0A9D4RWY2_DREPO|nr:hypothetical protein DPMN_005805 [Dreissena polymorpha]